MVLRLLSYTETSQLLSKHSSCTEGDDVPPISDLQFDTVSSTISFELPIPDEDEGVYHLKTKVCVGGSLH